LSTLVPTLTSQPFAGLRSQSAKPALHVKLHCELLHVATAFGRGGQTVLQPPQLFGLLRVSRHCPLQFV
jgi:hypothetical protein